MSNIKIVDGKVGEFKDFGDAVGTVDMIERNKVRIQKYRAKADQLEAENATLFTETKKLTIDKENLTKIEKIKLVRNGILKLKDFPGDDWLKDYVVGENGV